MSRYVQLVCAVCEMAATAMRSMGSSFDIFIYEKTSDMRLENMSHEHLHTVEGDSRGRVMRREQ